MNPTILPNVWLAPYVNYSLASLVVLSQVMSLVLLITIFLSTSENRVIRFIKKYGMMIAFIVAVVSMTGSLTYSNILGYEPCELCWFQRILMYPQVLILGLGIFRKDRNAILYSIILSIIGIPLALYHYLGQLGAIKLGCSSVGMTVSCSKSFHWIFGYITIPMMSFSAFLLIALLLLVVSGKSATPKGVEIK